MIVEQYPESEPASRTASGIPLKDPDSIKLFVGQVPRSMSEEELKPIFSEFGQLYELLVLRDKATGNHKGCAFVTYCTLESAEKAQRALHGNKVLPGMSRPIQVKPANSDDAAKLERKLFIGMISKQATEEDLMGMFSQFGEIEEQSILKDSDGNSKGCSFIKFKSAKDCHKAIRGMHHTLTMQGCSSPIVVKWADTDKERVVRRHQKLTDGAGGFPPPAENNRGGGPAPGPPPFLQNMPRSGYNMMAQQPPHGGAPAPPPAPSYNNNGSALLTAITPLLHNLASQSNPETNKALVNALIAALQALANCNNSSGNSRALTDIANLLNATISPSSNSDQNNMMPQQQQQQPPLQAPSSYGMRDLPPQLSKPDNGIFNSSTYSMNPYVGGASGPAAAPPAPGSSSQPGSKQSEGPDGANLFIYHIPADLRDNDLAEMFNTFGSIVSCKIFIDKATNQSKCFGFVSFDNPNSAQMAIQAMNGFKIGSKRLKVQLKKPKDAGKPF